MSGRGFGIGSVFDDGWASQYELETARELARNAARAREQQAAGWQDQMLAAAAADRRAIAAPLIPGIEHAGPANCAPQCAAGGCQFDRAAQMLAQAQQALEVSKRIMRRDGEGHRTMSAAMWCDVGQHAYSANDPAAEQWTKRIRDPETGEPRQVEMDVCGPCVKSGNSPDFNGPERAAIMAGADPHPAPDYVLRRPVPDRPQA